MSCFSGIRVIELTHVFAGPFAGYQLALQGADVIRIENPSDPDQSRTEGADAALNAARMGTSYLAQAANKRSVAIDLKTAAGVGLARRLIAGADVVIDNFRAGAMEGLGIGPAASRSRHSRLVYCSISAYGTTGPRATETGYDNVIQAASGLMALTGTSTSGPLKSGSQVVDYATGMAASFAIAAALLARERTGSGTHVDVSMYEVALSLATSHAVSVLRTGEAPAAVGNEHRYASSCSYDTRDGRLMLGASNLRQYRRLHDALATGWPAHTHGNADRRSLRMAEQAKIAQALSRLTSDEALQCLRAARVPASSVRNLAEAMADPQIAARNFVQQLATRNEPGDAVRVLTAPFSVSGYASAGLRHASRLGEDTWPVLNALGIAHAELEQLEGAGVIPAA